MPTRQLRQPGFCSHSEHFISIKDRHTRYACTNDNHRCTRVGFVVHGDLRPWFGSTHLEYSGRLRGTVHTSMRRVFGCVERRRNGMLGDDTQQGLNIHRRRAPLICEPSLQLDHSQPRHCAPRVCSSPAFGFAARVSIGSWLDGDPPGNMTRRLRVVWGKDAGVDDGASRR